MLVTLRKIKLSTSAVRHNSRMFRMYGKVDPLMNRVGMGRYEDERTPEGYRVMRADAIVDSTGRHWSHWSAVVDDQYNVLFIHNSNPEKNELRRGHEQDRAIDIALRTTDFGNPDRIGDGIWKKASEGLTLHTSAFNTGRDFQSLSTVYRDDMEILLVLASSPHDATEDAAVLNHRAVVALFAGYGVTTNTDKRGRWYLSGRRAVLVSHDGHEYTVSLIDGTKEAKGSSAALQKALDAAAKAKFKKRKDL